MIIKLLAYTFVILFLGTLIGSFIERRLFTQKASGVLRVDSSESAEEPYIFLELTDGLASIKDKKQVVLIVNTESYLSQK